MGDSHAMSPFVHRTPADARRVPWKNGRGVTEELAIGPAGASFEAGDFAWRVSRAAVVEDGPFSTFPGTDRVLVVTEGAGLVLAHAGRPGTTLAPLTVHRFRGDDATSATLVAGPVRDVGVLTRRDACVADVEVRAVGASWRPVPCPAGVALLLAVGGRVAARPAGGAVVDLAEGDLLLSADLRAPTEVGVSGAAGAHVLVVRIEARR